MPGESGVTVVTMLVCFFIFACEAAGASRARHSLRPLSWGRMNLQASGAFTPRECGGVCNYHRRHCEERKRRSNPSSILRCRAMDCFACARNDEAERSDTICREGTCPSLPRARNAPFATLTV